MSLRLVGMRVLRVSWSLVSLRASGVGACSARDEASEGIYAVGEAEWVYVCGCGVGVAA